MSANVGRLVRLVAALAAVVFAARFAAGTGHLAAILGCAH